MLPAVQARRSEQSERQRGPCYAKLILASVVLSCGEWIPSGLDEFELLTEAAPGQWQC